MDPLANAGKRRDVENEANGVIDRIRDEQGSHTIPTLMRGPLIHAGGGKRLFCCGRPEIANKLHGGIGRFRPGQHDCLV